jgi:hypothetical protein
MAGVARVLQFVIPNARRWARFKVDVPITLIIQTGKDSILVQGRGKDLNEGGMAVFAGAELNIGQQIAVEFTPAYPSQPIRIRCTVRNRRGYVYGIEFLLNNDRDQQEVNRLRTVLKGFEEARPK